MQWEQGGGVHLSSFKSKLHMLLMSKYLEHQVGGSAGWMQGAWMRWRKLMSTPALPIRPTYHRAFLHAPPTGIQFAHPLAHFLTPPRTHSSTHPLIHTHLVIARVIEALQAGRGPCPHHLHPVYSRITHNHAQSPSPYPLGFFAGVVEAAKQDDALAHQHHAVAGAGGGAALGGDLLPGPVAQVEPPQVAVVPELLLCRIVGAGRRGRVGRSVCGVWGGRSRWQVPPTPGPKRLGSCSPPPPAEQKPSHPQSHQPGSGM